MEYIMMLFKENTVRFIILGFINSIFSFLFLRILYLPFSKRVTEALGTRRAGISLYKKCYGFVTRGMAVCGKHFEGESFYNKARAKMRKAGYKSDHSAIVYLLVRYIASPVIFTAAFVLNYPEPVRPMISVVLINTIMEMVISTRKRNINLRLQKCIYKIYKYLHNQISSGMKPTDAIRSVYEIIDDRELKGILIRLAARYELTLDIDAALEEFRANFYVHEAETLCLALKQGIETGDNKTLLSRQEDVMFKKYFNYIQAETDSCRNRSVAAAAVFVSIVVVMIIVPMLNEVVEAFGKIFIN